MGVLQSLPPSLIRPLLSTTRRFSELLTSWTRSWIQKTPPIIASGSSRKLMPSLPWDRRDWSPRLRKTSDRPLSKLHLWSYTQPLLRLFGVDINPERCEKLPRSDSLGVNWLPYKYMSSRDKKYWSTTLEDRIPRSKVYPIKNFSSKKDCLSND